VKEVAATFHFYSTQNVIITNIVLIIVIYLVSNIITGIDLYYNLTYPIINKVIYIIYSCC